MDLSVIVPSIRMGNLKRLYDSVGKSFSGSFEFIIITPYDVPKTLQEKTNIKIIKDFGSPVRCMQIGLINCTGDYITWAADDGFYLDGSLDIAFNKIKEVGENHVVIGKYYEGGEGLSVVNMPQSHVMNSSNYYKVNFHDSSRSKFISDDCFMIMVGIVSRKVLFDIGGWDCRFEVCPMAFVDQSVRLFNYGCTFSFQNETMFRCGHMPGHEGDHGPVHDGQVLCDQPLFQQIYGNPESKDRKIINIDNWKESPEKWTRRFK